MTPAARAFDPRDVLAALEREYVAYVLIGGLARVLRGTDETTEGVDVCPSLRGDNVQRLGHTLKALGVDAPPLDLEREAVLTFDTPPGIIKIVAEPAGTRKGYEDLRRAATREHIGHGLRPSVASIADLARMAAALGRNHDLQLLPELRRILELEVGLQRHLGRERAKPSRRRPRPGR
jgi:hypothetical protein